jgi:hypothetical protein
MKYSDPYLSGVALGLVLLGSFVLAGRGLGASGAFAATATGTIATVAPAYAAEHPYFARYLARPGGPWGEWLVVELMGVAIGGFVSAALARRVTLKVERGRGVPVPARLAAAFAGGGVMGAGAVLARGCTSGQALTGGALLSVGSWAFMLSAFAAGYLVAPALRRAWQ